MNGKSIKTKITRRQLRIDANGMQRKGLHKKSISEIYRRIWNAEEIVQAKEEWQIKSKYVKKMARGRGQKEGNQVELHLILRTKCNYKRFNHIKAFPQINDIISCEPAYESGMYDGEAREKIGEGVM